MQKPQAHGTPGVRDKGAGELMGNLKERGSYRAVLFKGSSDLWSRDTSRST